MRRLAALLTSTALALGLGVWAASPSEAANTHVVTTTADAPAAGDTTDGVCQSTLPDGDCTLRAAISEANFGIDDVVQVPAGTYTLTIVGENEEGNATGDLDITNPQTIQGLPGAVIDAGGFERAIQIFGDRATIDGLTIRGAGVAAIDVFEADASITDTTVTDNPASAAAITVRNSFANNTRRAVTLDRVTIADNGGTGLSSGIFNATAPMDLSARSTTITGNGGTGLTLAGVNAVCTCVDVAVTDNGGSGITGRTLLGNGLTITGNNGNGVDTTTVSLRESVVTGNTFAGVSSANFTLVATTVSQNGGIGVGRSGSNFSEPITGLVVDSTVAANTGGGLLAHIETEFNEPTTEAARLAVLGSTVIDNGGPGIQGDDLEVFNSTITGNAGRGVDAIRRPYGASIDHSTIAGNGTVGATGNVANVRRLTSSIIGAPAAGNNCLATDGPVRSFGYNVISDESCALVANDHSLDGTDVEGVGTAGLHLGPLRDNGGPTLTHFPLAGSPALDRQPASGCAGADQRGVPRPFGTGCDSGAVEAVFEPVSFADVPATASYQAGLRWVIREEILTGFEDGTFRPTKVLKRKNVVVALWQLAGAPTGSPEHSFTDVPDGASYEAALDWAAANGIVTGTTFRPDGELKRKQLVKMLWPLAGSPTGSPPHPFTDVAADVGYADALDWAAEHHLFTGTTFGPTKVVKRWALAEILWTLAITPAAWDAPAPPTVPFAPAG